MKRWLSAGAMAAALSMAWLFNAAPANAACPYTGNTTGTDSAAALNALNDICANSASPPAQTVQPGNTQNTTPWLVGNTTATVAINISTATTTELIPLSSGKVIVAYPVIISGGTDNVTFEYGSGTACAAGTTVLTGALGLLTGSGIASPVPLHVPAGKALCALTGSVIQISGWVSYNQYTP